MQQGTEGIQGLIMQPGWSQGTRTGKLINELLRRVFKTQDGIEGRPSGINLLYHIMNTNEPLDEREDSPWKFTLGAEIYYKDPDQGISSGDYQIIERMSVDEDREFNRYLLSNGRFNLEAYERDLSE